MKKLFTILLLSITFNLFSQVDTLYYNKLAFEYINKYREYHGVSRMEWSNEIYKASREYSMIMFKYNIDNMKKTNQMYLKHSNEYWWSENLAAWIYPKKSYYTNRYITDSLTLFTKKYFNDELDKYNEIQFIIVKSLYQWHTSKTGHKENILNIDQIKGAYSIITGDSEWVDGTKYYLAEYNGINNEKLIKKSDMRPILIK